MSKKTIFVYVILIMTMGLFQERGHGQAQNQETPNAAVINVLTQSDNTCRDENNKWNARQQNLKNICTQLASEYGDKTAKIADPGDDGSYPNCQAAVSNCDSAIQKEEDGTASTLYDKLNKKPDPDATPDPKPPQPTDPRYCDPDLEPDANPTAATVPDTLKTPCMTQSARNRANILSSDLKGDDSTLNKKQDAFDKAESKLLDTTSNCQENIRKANLDLAAARQDLASAAKEQQNEIGSNNVNNNKELLALRDKATQVQALADQATGSDAIKALADYTAEINAALAACHQNLVMLGKANQLQYSSLGQALGASSVGLTSSKCQTDFTNQQARMAAWMKYTEAQQVNNEKYMNAERQLATLSAQANTLALQLGIIDNATATRYANRMTADQTRIASDTEGLTQLDNSCASQITLGQNNATNAMAKSNDEAKDARVSYCQLQDLKNKYGVNPSKSSDKDSQELKDDHKKLLECDTGCSDPCKTDPQCSDSPTCTKKPRDLSKYLPPGSAK